MTLNSKNNYGTGIYVSPVYYLLKEDYNKAVDNILEAALEGVKNLKNERVIGYLNIFVTYKMQSIFNKHCRYESI